MPQESLKEFHAAPEWLTKEYVEEKLQKLHQDESIKVTKLHIQPATAKGENYASVMTRIKVIYNTNNSHVQNKKSMLVKTTFEGKDPASHVMNSYHIYKREMEMYEKVLPKLSELLESIGDKDKLVADTIFVDHHHSAIIFEDLAESNFMMADRTARLDMNHTCIALKKLAKMHATTAVLKERKPDVFAHNFDYGIFNRRTDAFKPMITGVLAALTRYVGKNKDLCPKFHYKLIALQSRIMEYGARVFDSVDNHFFTLVHGDFWTNNMMFTYDNKTKEPLDVIPIDFQFSAWASPAVDLHYFFNTSLNEDLRLHNQPELVLFYYNTLAETLRALNYGGSIPSLYDFRIQLEMRSFYALASAFIFQPIMLCEETEDANFNNLVSECERGIRFKDNLFRNQKVQEYIAHLLPIFDQKGLLDVMDSIE